MAALYEDQQLGLDLTYRTLAEVLKYDNKIPCVREHNSKIDRRNIFCFEDRLGTSGAGKTLNDMLMEFGDRTMAEEYLNSGSAELENGGR